MDEYHAVSPILSIKTPTIPLPGDVGKGIRI